MSHRLADFVASQLGLDWQQVLIVPDHFLVPLSRDEHLSVELVDKRSRDRGRLVAADAAKQLETVSFGIQSTEPGIELGAQGTRRNDPRSGAVEGCVHFGMQFGITRPHIDLPPVTDFVQHQDQGSGRHA